MDGKKITTYDETRQAIVDLYVEEIEQGISRKIDRKIAEIVQSFPGLCGLGTMRKSRSKALKIVEEKRKKNTSNT